MTESCDTQRRQPVLLLQTYIHSDQSTERTVNNVCSRQHMTKCKSHKHAFFVTHSKTLKLIYFNWTNVSKWNTLLSLREGVGTSCSFVGVVWGWAILCHFEWPKFCQQMSFLGFGSEQEPTVVVTFLHLATWGFRAHLGSHHHSVFWLLNCWFMRLWWEWKYLHVINHLTAC